MCVPNLGVEYKDHFHVSNIHVESTCQINVTNRRVDRSLESRSRIHVANLIVESKFKV